MINYWDKGH